MAATYDVILPAGGVLDPHFARVALTPTKALIKVRDGVLILNALTALQLSNRARRVVVIGNEEVRSAVGDRVDAVLAPGAGIGDNVMRGLKELLAAPEPPERILILTTDLPYLNEKVLAAWLDSLPSADFCGALVSEEAYLDRFPGSTSTFATLREGRYTLGGAYVARVDALRRAMPQIERAIAQRKSITGMASLLGAGFMMKVMTKRASVADVENKIAEIVGATIKAVPNSPPELAFDIDDIPDYEYALRNP